MEETILEVATDKVDSEVPAPCNGVIKEIRFQPNEVVAIGTVVAIIEASGEVTISETEAEEESKAPASASISKSNGQSEFKLRQCARSRSFFISFSS